MRHSARGNGIPTASRISYRGFTLTELMIAIVVLIVVIIATSKIFGTASQITRIGQATAAVMQEAATIEDQLRSDIAHLTDKGFFAIRGVAVRNDVKGAGQPLLNPNLPPGAVIRADQLMFFTDGVDSPQTSRLTQGSNRAGQGTAARVYWGPAFQLGDLGLPAVVDNYDRVRGYDPNVGSTTTANPLWTAITPWTNGTVAMATLLYATEGGAGGPNGNDIYGPGAPTIGPAAISLFQPPATRWLLARQAVVLVDDDSGNSDSNQKTVYEGQIATARSIFYNAQATAPWGYSREIRNGRMDAAAVQLNDVRRFITIRPPWITNVPREWADNSVPIAIIGGDQRNVIRNALYYPRAERKAPSMNRVDQALTNHVIGSACSNFIVDWTYFNGVGDIDGNGDGIYDWNNPATGDLGGIVIPSNVEQLWFGMPDCTNAPGSFVLPDPVRGTRPLSANLDFPMTNWVNQQNPTSIYFYNIEPNDPSTSSAVKIIAPGVYVYEAFFGYNQTRPYWDESVVPAQATSTPTIPIPPTRMKAGYTPWPSAIRITMTLHDPDGRLEGGREFQFVIDLPKRSSSQP